MSPLDHALIHRMAAPQPDQPGSAAPAAKKSRLAGLTAESTIAVALISVVLIVAGAWWLLKLREEPAPDSPAADSATESAPAPAGDASAPVQWQTALQGKVAELQEQRRVEQERTEAEHRHAIEQQQQAQAAAAEEQRRKAEQDRLAAAARAAPPPVAPPAAAPASATAKSQGVTVAAKVDWSSCSQPSYPQASIRRKEEGVVIMAFHVDAAGKVIEKRIDKSSGSQRLDQTALESIGKCRFTPGSANGVPAATWAMMRFVWKLEG